MGNIIGIGETVFDIILKDNQPQFATPGGSTFNAIVSLGRVGCTPSIVTEVGDDHVGDLTCNYLRQNGVSSEYVCCHKGTQSHVSLAFLDQNNDAHYQFYKDHAALSLNGTMPHFNRDDIVIFGSFFAINPAIRKQVKALLQQAHNAGSTLYYDINFRASHIADIPQTLENINENMRLASVVRGSLEDFGYLYNTSDIEQIYQQHIAPFCPNFICTNGNKAIELRTATWRHTFDVKPIETVSTVGAGDNFNAGFVYALRQMSNHKIDEFTLNDWAKLIDCGQAFAADVCRQFGNNISAEFAENIIKQHQNQ